MNYLNFYKEIESFKLLPEKVSSFSVESFRNTFSSEVDEIKGGIVYTWQSEKPTPRLRGESNVLYIGQTKHAFKQRYRRYAEARSLMS